MSQPRLDQTLLLALAVLTTVNGLWMLVSPDSWYTGLPAALPDFGPLNRHFVRDTGCAFLAVGVALCWAWRSPVLRTPMLAISAMFYGAHGLVHVFDTVSGAVGVEHLWIDLPGTYLPIVILGFLLGRREA